MITIRLKGGLGNQMFQYAFARGMAAKLNTSFKIDCTLLLDRARQEQVVYRDYDIDIFNIKEQFSITPSILRAIYKVRFASVGKLMRESISKGKNYQKERHFHVDQELLHKPTDNSIYEGWWQSQKYWSNVEEELREEFGFKDAVLPSSEPILKQINESNSVCLNVRRTDFVNNPTLNATNLEYFNNAVEKMASLVDRPHFFIFSDDLDWCRENLLLDHPFEIISHAEKGRKFGNYLQLMSACKHFIIPNSSFAWWAVWLSNKENQNVIAPKNWFNEGDYDTTDMVPENWIRL